MHITPPPPPSTFPNLLKKLGRQLLRKRLREGSHALLGVVRLPIAGEELARDLSRPLLLWRLYKNNTQDTTRTIKTDEIQHILK